MEVLRSSELNPRTLVPPCLLPPGASLQCIDHPGIVIKSPNMLDVTDSLQLHANTYPAIC